MEKKRTMNLTSLDLQNLCNLAKEAAIKAGAYIASKANANLQVNKKTGGDTLASQVVTEVDLKAQEIILEVLDSANIKYNLGLLTEESVDDSSRFEKEYFWCIDPLDGTLSFIEGVGGYAVSIALVSKSGTSVIGVVYNPTNKELFHAVKGQGAYKNDERLEIKKTDAFIFSTDRSFMKNPSFDLLVKELDQFANSKGYSNFKLEKTSGAVVNGVSTIDKAPGCYFKFPKKENGGGSLWDFAASACIVLEAGGIVTDIFGLSLDLNREDSTFMNHKGIIYASNTEIADFIGTLYKKYF